MITGLRSSLVFGINVLLAVAMSYAADNTILGPIEINTLRNGNTRVWQTSKIISSIDPLTGLPTGTNETVHGYIYEKADGLNYNAGTDEKPDWQPTIETIQQVKDYDYPYEAIQGPYQVRFRGGIGGDYPISYTQNGKTLRMGLRFLGFYDKTNGTLQTIQSPTPALPVLQGNTLTYHSIFPGVILQYVYQKSSFHQNLIFQNQTSIPSPSSYNINTTNVYLVSVTEIDTSSVACTITNSDKQTLTDGDISGESQELFITDSTNGNIICQFTLSEAIDNSPNNHSVFMYKKIYQQDGHIYLLEGVPYSWMQSAQYPVTLDYNAKTGGQSDNEVWRSGQTYYISGDYSINNGYTLAIEGGAICKFSTGRRITVNSGATLLAKGDKFNYVLFTSAKDTSVGESICTTGCTPAAGDYSIAIYLYPGSSVTSRIEYCKIAYADYGIDIQTKVNNPIQNNIMRLNHSADIWVTKQGSSTGDGVTVKNNLLIGNATYGIYGHIRSDQSYASYIIANNNTIDGHNTALYAYNSSFLSCKNNLVSNCTNGLVADPAYGVFGQHSYNKFYQVITPWSGVTSTIGENTSSNNPYVTCPNGSYYLNQSDTTVIDAGENTAEYFSLNYKTTTTAKLVTGNINENQIWEKVPRDTGTVDMGFHYDPVDVIVGSDANNDQVLVSGKDVTLVIDPGVVVAFYRNQSNPTTTQAKLQVTNGAYVISTGYSGNEIEFTSIYATSDLLNLPLRGGLDKQDYDFGLLLEGGLSPKTNIQYCKFHYALVGVSQQTALNIDRPIQNNFFDSNRYGLALYAYNGNALNNLFVNNTVGLWVRADSGNRQIAYIQNNTFYGNETGMIVELRATGSTDTQIVRLENNIFTSNRVGVWGNDTVISSPAKDITAETRSNLYWNNGTNIYNSGTFSTGSIGFNNVGGDNADTTGDANPMLVHQATLANNTFLSSTVNDGFYLAQVSGDASRFPLRQKDLIGIDVSGIPEIPSIGKLYVYASDSATSTGSELGHYDVSGGYSDGTTTTGNILLKFVCSDGSWNLSGGTTYVTLYFAPDSTKIKVYLPSFVIQETESLSLWVAQDGSSYYGDKGHGKNNLNQDAWFAMEYDMPNGLAKSAYSVGGRSVAVDKGSVRVTDKNLIGTNNDVKYTILAAEPNAFTKTNGDYDTQTTIRDILDSIPTDYTDPLGRIDVGYHYGGQLQFVTEVLCKASTKISGTDTFFRYADIFQPPAPGLTLREKAVASANLNKTNLSDTTIVLYTAKDTTSTRLNAIVYHVINTPINRVLTTYPTYISSTEPMGMRSLSVCATPAGNIFAGVFYNSNTQVGNSPNANHHEEIHLYRYNSSGDTWTEIANYVKDVGSGPTTGQNFFVPDTAVITGAITADETTAVWVAWYENFYSNNTLYLRAAYVPQNPVGIVNIDTIARTPIENGVKITYLTHGKLDVTYDPTIVRTPNNPNTVNGDVRIIYHEEQSTTALIVEPKVSKFLTTRSSGNITRENNTSFTLESTATSRTPRIKYNPNDTLGGKKHTFASFRVNPDPSKGPLNAFDLDTTNPTGEIWSFDSSISNYTTTNEPTLTYRGNGDKLLVWGVYVFDTITTYYIGQTLVTDTIYKVLLDSNGFSTTFGMVSAQTPVITTSSGNQRDLFLIWQDQYYYNGDLDMDLVVGAKELYP